MLKAQVPTGSVFQGGQKSHDECTRCYWGGNRPSA